MGQIQNVSGTPLTIATGPNTSALVMPGSSVTVADSLVQSYVANPGQWQLVTTPSSFTASAGEEVNANASGGAFNVYLPPVVSGGSVWVKKVDSSANAVTVLPNAGDSPAPTIDGATSYVLSVPDQSCQVVSDGSEWRVLAPTGAYAPVGDTATVYVSKGTSASDSNDGATPYSAKATIAGALSALGWDVSTPTVLGKPGKIQVLYGTWGLTSYERQDTGCGLTNGSVTVTDASITTADVGALVSGSNIAGIVLAVNPGVSFTCSTPANATTSETLTIDRPGVIVPPGVEMEGLGSSASSGMQTTDTAPDGTYNFVNMFSASMVQDSGNGITVAGWRGNGEASTAVKGAIRNISVYGNATRRVDTVNTNSTTTVTDPSITSADVGSLVSGSGIPGGAYVSSVTPGVSFVMSVAATSTVTGLSLTLLRPSTNVCGVYSGQIWQFDVDGCDISYHGTWGVHLGGNSVNCPITNCLIGFNGSPAATVSTGGIYQGGYSASGVKIDECAILYNCGYGVFLNAGGAILNTSFAQTYKTPSTVFSQSGINAVVSGSYDGTSVIDNCWLEAAYGVAEVFVQAGPVKVSNSMFQGASITHYGVWGSGNVNVDSCIFQGHTIGSVWVPGTAVASWNNCLSDDPWFMAGVSFGSITIPVSAAPGRGTWGAPGLVTTPVAATSVALASGTPWQNTTGSDVILAIPVTYTAGGSAQIARGNASPGTPLGTIVRAGADHDVLEYYVPAQWYVTITLTGATFTANATAQPV